MNARGRISCLLVSVLLGCGCSSPRDREPINVILISIDCLNARQFQTAIASGTTPVMFDLTKHATVFTRAHAHAPWTTPSHMSMLTGLYPLQHGRDTPWPFMARFNQYFDRVPEYPSITSHLAANGYQTIAFTGKGSISAGFGIGEGFDEFTETPKGHDLVRTIDLFTTWLETRAHPPFFLFLHTYDMHPRKGLGYPDETTVLQHVDQALGTIFAKLRQKGWYDSSLIFLTGDHGSAMIRTEGKCCAHGTGHYEENLHVPLVVKLPGSPAATSDVLARHIDIFPTVMDVLDLPAADYRGEGISLLTTSSSADADRISFSEADSHCVQRYAATTIRYKYIYTPRNVAQQILRANPMFDDRTCPAACAKLPPAEEFYDLEADPFEEHDLQHLPAMPGDQVEALRKLRAAMEAHLNVQPQYRRVVELETAGQMDEELRDAMRSLGYLD